MGATACLHETSSSSSNEVDLLFPFPLGAAATRNKLCRSLSSWPEYPQICVPYSMAGIMPWLKTFSAAFLLALPSLWSLLVRCIWLDSLVASLLFLNLFLGRPPAMSIPGRGAAGVELWCPKSASDLPTRLHRLSLVATRLALGIEI